MTFVVALVVMIVVMVAIFIGVIWKIRGKPRNPAQSTQVTMLEKRAGSSRTSTACMADDTTFKSLHEPLSVDEGVNNNVSYPHTSTNYHRPRVSGPIRINNRACVHICPRCCDHLEGCSFEFNDVPCQTECRPRLHENQHGPVMHDPLRESRGLCRMIRADENEQRHLIDYL